MTDTDRALLDAAWAIERTTTFRRRFHPGPEPPSDHTHPAALEFARAALAAVPHPAEDVWDTARDRITETNQAIRAERERCAQLADKHLAWIPGESLGPGQAKPGRWFADLIWEAL